MEIKTLILADLGKLSSFGWAAFEWRNVKIVDCYEAEAGFVVTYIIL